MDHQLPIRPRTPTLDTPNTIPLLYFLLKLFVNPIISTDLSVLFPKGPIRKQLRTELLYLSASLPSQLTVIRYPYRHYIETELRFRLTDRIGTSVLTRLDQPFLHVGTYHPFFVIPQLFNL